jgi:hypothetical protein
LGANGAGIAQDFLAATRAIEFKIAHGIKRPSSSFTSIGRAKDTGKGQLGRNRGRWEANWTPAGGK